VFTLHKPPIIWNTDHSTYTWQTHSSTGPGAYIIHHAFNRLPASNNVGYFLFAYSNVQSVTNTQTLRVMTSQLSATLDNDLTTTFRSVLKKVLSTVNIYNFMSFPIPETGTSRRGPISYKVSTWNSNVTTIVFWCVVRYLGKNYWFHLQERMLRGCRPIFFLNVLSNKHTS
jgi:hypothetical protein